MLNPYPYNYSFIFVLRKSTISALGRIRNVDQI